MIDIAEIITEKYPALVESHHQVVLTKSELHNLIVDCLVEFISRPHSKDEYRNLYTTLARAVETGDPLVIGLTVGQVVERLKTLSE